LLEKINKKIKEEEINGKKYIQMKSYQPDETIDFGWLIQ
jgi:hypothetical protein